MIDLIALIHQIAYAIYQGTERPRPKIELLKVDKVEVVAELEKVPISPLGIWDTDYYYTKSEDWAEALNYLYFDFNMPSYISERTDCDDFAILLKGLVSGYFGLNYFGVVIGNAPGGYHAWNIFRVEDRLVQFEPQTGKIFELNEEGYKPSFVLL